MEGPSRSFYAHDRHDHRAGGCMIHDAESFHDAAIAYAERAAPADPEDVLAVIVRDCESGEEQCFVVHLDDGQATPC